MWVILYLIAVIAWLLVAQTVVLLAFKQPLQWTYGANSQQPKSLKLVLKFILQATLIGSIFFFPYLVGSSPGAYYGPMLPWEKAQYFLYGEALAIFLMWVTFGVMVRVGWLYYKPRYTPNKALTKSLLSTLSSFTVVAVEEPFFRGIIMGMFLAGGMDPVAAIGLSAALFSVAHFLKKVPNYWPFIGLAVLGVWLGAGFYKTGNLWFPMGLHSGGILSIGVHRCFLNYRGPVFWTGSQTFPIAGGVGIIIMLIGTAVTWIAVR